MRAAWLLVSLAVLGCAARALPIPETVEAPDLADAEPPPAVDLAAGSTADLSSVPTVDFGAMDDLASPPRAWFKTSSGLPPGQIDCVIGDPKIAGAAYAGTWGGGVFKTVDSGAHWSSSKQPMADPYIDSVEIDPNDSRHLFASGTSLSTSLDGGESWSTVDYGGVTPIYFEAQATFDPATPHLVYLANGASLFRSTDGGVHWSDLGTPAANPMQVFVDSADAKHLFARTYMSGTFVSSDSGASWSLLPAPSTGAIASLAFDPGTQTLCVADSSNSGNLYVSTNGGASWTNVSPPSIYTVADWVTVLPGPVFYASGNYTVFRSTNCVDWQSVYDSTMNRVLGPVSGDAAGTTYLSAAQHVLRSADGITNWTAIDDGIDDTFIDVMALDSASPSDLYIAAGQGIYHSSDGAATWQPADGPSFAVAALAANGGDVLASGYDAIGNQVYRSLDRGTSWEPSALGTATLAPVAFAFDPAYAINHTIFAATEGVGPGLSTSIDRAMSWSADPAASWSSALVAVDAAHSGRVWTVNSTPSPSPGVSLHRSDDSGASWTPVALPVAGVPSAFVLSSDGETLYAAVDSTGVLKSVDGGGHFTLTGPGYAYFTAQSLVVDPSDSNTVYLVVGTGIEKSSDGGVNWASVSQAMPGLSVNSLVIDPAQPKVLYAGTINGVWKTVTGGQ